MNPLSRNPRSTPGVFFFMSQYKFLVLITSKEAKAQSRHTSLDRTITACGGSVVECWARDQGVGGCVFEPPRRHCVVSLSKAIYPLHGTGSTQEDLF